MQMSPNTRTYAAAATQIQIKPLAFDEPLALWARMRKREKCKNLTARVRKRFA
jgi:hypothetical protein